MKNLHYLQAHDYEVEIHLESSTIYDYAAKWYYLHFYVSH